MANTYTDTPQNKDPHMWEIARRRASFRYHLASYIIVIGAMWIGWYFSSESYNSHPWPVWPTMGWGIGLTFHFLGAFVFPGSNSVEREYEKLMRDKKRS